jgi:MFS family permease
VTRVPIFAGWYVVLGSGAGIAFGSVVFMGTGFALISGAMAHDFGWSQVEVVKAATLFLGLITLSWPMNGWLLDRYGARRVALGSILAFALSLLALTQVSTLTEYYLAFAVMGLVSGSTNAISYARAISLWFDRRRGLALGLATSLQGVGGTALPLMLAWAIAWGGYAFALELLAGILIFFCLPMVALLVIDDPKSKGLRADGAPGEERSDGQPMSDASGMDLGQVIGSRIFWQLAICFFLAGGTFYALNANFAYILKEASGGDPVAMSKIIAAGGFAVIFGRFIFGYLLDVASAPLVGASISILCMVYLGMFLITSDFYLIMVAAFIGGLVGGGESDLMPYLAGRYFGNRALSKILGLFFFAFFLGAAIGPISFANAAASFGGVHIPLTALILLQLVPIAIFLSLARRPVNPN